MSFTESHRRMELARALKEVTTESNAVDVYSDLIERSVFGWEDLAEVAMSHTRRSDYVPHDTMQVTSGPIPFPSAPTITMSAEDIHYEQTRIFAHALYLLFGVSDQERIGMSETLRILDLGSGTGILLATFARVINEALRQGRIPSHIKVIEIIGFEIVEAAWDEAFINLVQRDTQLSESWKISAYRGNEAIGEPEIDEDENDKRKLRIINIHADGKDPSARFGRQSIGFINVGAAVLPTEQEQLMKAIIKGGSCCYPACVEQSFNSSQLMVMDWRHGGNWSSPDWLPTGFYRWPYSLGVIFVPFYS